MTDSVFAGISVPEVREHRPNQGFSKEKCPDKFIWTTFLQKKLIYVFKLLLLPVLFNHLPNY